MKKVYEGEVKVVWSWGQTPTLGINGEAPIQDIRSVFSSGDPDPFSLDQDQWQDAKAVPGVWRVTVERLDEPNG